MRLFYYVHPVGNFGDDLNLWLWPRLFPQAFGPDDEDLFVGIGSIVDGRIPRSSAKKVFFGSGVRPGSTIRRDATWDIRFLRGPLSAKAFGGGARWISDGAICIRFAELPEADVDRRAVFIPHFHTVRDYPCVLKLESERFRTLDPRQDVPQILASIRGAQRVVAESLHGAIIADTLRIPWIRTSLYSWRTETLEVSSFKWSDWALSMEVDAKGYPLRSLPRYSNRFLRVAYRELVMPARMPGLRRSIHHILDRERFNLSTDAVYSDRLRQAEHSVQHFADVQHGAWK